MKNFIKSNYNLYPTKIYKKNNNYFFFSDSDKILIVNLDKKKNTIDKYVKISNELYNNKINISTFLINVNGEYYTKRNDDFIALLKCNTTDSDISLKDIYEYTNKYIADLDELNIISIWKNTIDTIEKEMTEYKNEYKVIQESLNYFIGISENAIQLLNSVKYDDNSIGHNILLDNFNIYELHNPLNLVKTNKLYDISLYLKYKFYNDYIDYEELHNILHGNNKKDLIFLYACMLYQNEFFFDVKNVLLNKKDEKILFKYIDNIKKYKEILKYLKNDLHSIIEINDIEWIDK